MSLPEVLLWQAIRGRRLEGIRFRRQHPLGPYVLDFYCPEHAVCVEVDGAAHRTEDRPRRDAARDAWLAARGIRTLRLPASVVLDEVDDAVRTIAAFVGAGPLRPSATSPRGGGSLRQDAPPLGELPRSG